MFITQIGKDINECIRHLENGEAVAIPTETVYGLAANALDEDAILKVFKIKERPLFDPLIVHTSAFERAEDYVESVPDLAYQLADAFMPGPLTIILPKTPKIPDLVTSGLPAVAIRVPQHILTRKLLACLPFPLAAPSANPFGYVSPTSPQHVYKQLSGKIPYILDGGYCSVGIESTIVRVIDAKRIQILRYGGISPEDIKKVNPFIEIEMVVSKEKKPIGPGQLKSHYATKKPLQLMDRSQIEASLRKGDFDQKTGLMLFQPMDSVNGQEVKSMHLSEEGSFTEAAKNLFKCMRELDEDASIQAIVAERFPNEGLGYALNDRLKRAAVKRNFY